jgi:uncharacterized membrane protein
MYIHLFHDVQQSYESLECSSYKIFIRVGINVYSSFFLYNGNFGQISVQLTVGLCDLTRKVLMFVFITIIKMARFCFLFVFCSTRRNKKNVLQACPVSHVNSYYVIFQRYRDANLSTVK